MAPRIRNREIADDLRRRLQAGEWVPGDTIPRAEDLAEEYQAARGTVAEAIKILEIEGLLQSVQRRGTVVLEPRPRRRVPRGTHVHRRRPEGGYSFAATTPNEPTW